jgi:hypothetical protein
MLLRQHASKQFGNAKLWVSEAVARDDKMFDKPLWRGERTVDDEYDERLRRIKVLRKHHDTHPQADAVADQLEDCERGTRCLSGACPECAHLLQRWFVRRSKRFIADYLEKPGTDLVAVSIIPVKSTARTGKLERISAANCLRVKIRVTAGRYQGRDRRDGLFFQRGCQREIQAILVPTLLYHHLRSRSE